MTPEIQDHMEITPVKEYPLYAGGRLLIGNVTRRTGMTVGTDPIHCRIEVPEGVGSYPKEWFPITEIRSMVKLTQLLDNNSSPHGLFLPKEILLDCYRSAWERLRHVIADMQMMIDEHQMDNMHAFQEGGEDERRKVVAHLRERAIHGAGNTFTVEDACTVLADLFERGEHRREENE